MKDEYKLEKEITSVEVDFNLECKLSHLFMFFQEAAYYHTELLGIGKSATIDKGLHWVIARFDVDIIEMPKYGDKIIISTYPGESNALFYYRHFRIEDKKHRVLVKAVSLWAVINAATHQIVKDAFHGLKLPVKHKEDELPLPNKLSYDGSLDHVYDALIKYSDIDLNTHLNNTRYIELVQNAFDLSFYEENVITHISINYLKELQANNKVEIYRSNGSPIVIVGKYDGNNHFVASVDVRKRK